MDNRWMDKQMYICIVEYYSALKRSDILAYATYNMDEPRKYYPKWNKDMTPQVYDPTYRSYLK